MAWGPLRIRHWSGAKRKILNGRRVRVILLAMPGGVNSGTRIFIDGERDCDIFESFAVGADHVSALIRADT